MSNVSALAVIAVLAVAPLRSVAQTVGPEDAVGSVVADHMHHLERMIKLWPRREYYLQLADLYGRTGESSRQLELYEVAYDMGWLDQTGQFVQFAQLLLRARRLAEADAALDEALSLEAAKRSRRETSDAQGQ